MIGPDTNEGGSSPSEELTLPEKEQSKLSKLVEAERKLLRTEKGRSSYYEMVPLEFRRVIDDISNENFPFYQNDPRFRRDNNLFREAIAENWLLRIRSSKKIFESFGMKEMDTSAFDRDWANTQDIALLTKTGSHVLFSPGVFTHPDEGPGGAIIYDRMPFRDDTIESFLLPTGGHVYEDITLGKHLTIAPLGSVSRILLVYSRDGATPNQDQNQLESQKLLSAHLKQSTLAINSLTMKHKGWFNW